MANAGADKVESLQNDKRFVFQGNLNRLLVDPKRVPPSANPCKKCVQRKRVCICSTITGAVGRAPAYEISELRDIKTVLSELKDSLNDVDIDKWSAHTKLLDKTSLVVKQVGEITTFVNGKNEPGVELATNAWLKLYEILQVYKVLDELKPNLSNERGVFRSFHISECPGGFISALNHLIKSKNSVCEHSWMATSLNPYHEANSHHECLAEDILFRETHNRWINGADESGNITRTENIEYIWDHVSRPSRYNKNKEPVLFDLVTADGSFDCQSDPNNQEKLTALLKLSEVVCALGLMRVGSTFILKMFTLFEESSLSIMTLLNMCFKSVEVYKPQLSKSSSSEIYVICTGFNGITSVLLCALCKLVNDYSAIIDRKSIIPKEWVPSAFRAEFVECSKMFAELQCRSMRNTMSKYMQPMDENALYKTKREFSKLFVSQFNIEAITSDCRLVKYISYTDSVITSKSTSSLFHVPKRYLAGLEARRAYLKIYKDLQHRRKELYKQYKAEKQPSHFLNISEEATCADFGSNIKEAIKFSNSNKPEYPDLTMDRLSLDLSEALISDLRGDLKNQRYLKDSWFVAAPLHVHEIRSSHFVCNDLLFDVTRLRIDCSERVPIVTAKDILLFDGGVGEALSDLNLLPNAGTTDLALIFKRFLDINRYKSYLEITTNPSQQFPAISLLKRHGIAGSLIFGFKPAETGKSLIHFDSFYDLQVIVNSFVGDGSVIQCLEFNYDDHLTKCSGYKLLTSHLAESTLKGSCDFIYCDTRKYASYHREVCFDEMRSKHVIVAQIVQAINCISPDGDLVIATSTLFTRFSISIVTVLRVVFDEVHLYRPASVSPWTQQTYVICKGYNDRENSLCRHFMQCLWDAICLHKKGNKEVVHSIRPVHFTHMARKVWEFNTKLLLDEFEDIAIHAKGNAMEANREGRAIELLRSLGVIDILYPPRLIASYGPCTLPLHASVGTTLSADNASQVDVVTVNSKRQREEDEEKDMAPTTPSESPSPEGNDSPIWSSDEN